MFDAIGLIIPVFDYLIIYYLLTYLCMYLFINLFVYLFIHLFIRLFIYYTIFLNIYIIYTYIMIYTYTIYYIYKWYNISLYIIYYISLCRGLSKSAEYRFSALGVWTNTGGTLMSRIMVGMSGLRQATTSRSIQRINKTSRLSHHPPNFWSTKRKLINLGEIYGCSEFAGVPNQGVNPPGWLTVQFALIPNLVHP